MEFPEFKALQAGIESARFSGYETNLPYCSCDISFQFKRALFGQAHQQLAIISLKIPY